MGSDKKRMGFSFFVWVSASLFILAAANWTFNKFIDLFTSVSIWWGMVVLFLAIFLIAAFLYAAYNAVPIVKEILNGVLGLNTTHVAQENSIQEASKRSPTNLQESDKNRAKFDKDIELAKLNIVSDEWRSRRSDAYALIFTFLAVIYAAITGLAAQIASNQITTSLFTLVFIAILIFGFVAITLQLLMVNERREKRLCELNSLVRKVESHESIGDLYEILRKK